MALYLFDTGKKLLNQRSRDVNDEDFVQRVFGTYAIVAIVVLSIITTPGQYFSSPISCWSKFDSGFSSSYFERRCLIEGTYGIPENSHVETYRAPNSMHWYPFAPLLVISQIIPFLLIVLLWKSCNQSSGVQISKATEAAKTIQSVGAFQNLQKEHQVLDYICENLHAIRKNNYTSTDFEEFKSGFIARLKQRISKLTSSKNPSYLSNLLIVVKFLNILAIIVNVIWLSSIIGSDFFYIGFKFFYRMSLSRPVLFDELFPILVMCRQENQVGMNMNKTYQYPCVLNLNVFNEKVFIFLWFLYFLLFILGVVDVIQTLCFRCSARAKFEYFITYFPVANSQSQLSMQKKFFTTYASNDCCTALKIMSGHLDNLTMTLLCYKLYNYFKTEHTKMQAHEDVNINDPTSSGNNEDMNDQIDNIDNFTRKSLINFSGGNGNAP